MDWSTIASAGSSVLGGLFGIFGSKAQRKSNERMNAANIAAQERINKANIDNQNRINQQNIDFQKDINSIMRNDSLNAISNKKADLARAGYSTAAPDLQGFQTANLSSPNQVMATQQAAMQSPNVDGSVVGSMLSGINGMTTGIQSTAKLASEIALNKANAKSANANATGQEIDNGFKAAQNEAQLEQIYANIDDMVASKELKRSQAVKVYKDVDIVSSQIELLGEQIKQAKFTSEHQLEQFTNEMNRLVADTLNLKASAKKSDSETAINKVSKQIKDIEFKFAKLGINFNSNDYVSALARIVMSPDSAKIIPALTDFISNSFGALLDSVPSMFSNIGDKVIDKITSRDEDGVPNALKILPQYHIIKAGKKIKKKFFD